MAVAVATTATSYGSSTASPGVSITMPSGISSGDLLICFVSADEPVTYSASGWTKIVEAANSTYVQLSIFAKIAAGSDTMTLVGGAYGYAAAVLRITGHGVSDVSTEIGPSSSANTGNSQFPDPPSMTFGTSAERLWLPAFAAENNSADNLYQPSGYYLAEHVANTGSPGSGVCIGRALTTASSVNPTAASIEDASHYWVATTLGVSPAAAPVKTGAGTLAAQSADIDGSGKILPIRGTGALASQAASISGAGLAISAITGAGAPAAQSASISGLGGVVYSPSLPISMNVLQPVVVGLPVRVDIRTAVMPSLPIVMGRYPVTPTLPIRMDVYRAATLPTLPISIAGKWTDAGLVTWTPKCLLDGVDISSQLIGAQDIEFEEDAAPIASFSFIPAAGAVDPLMWVGKTCSLSWVTGNTQILAFTGVVSDPEWDAESRIVTISATGDLQSKLDAMDKTAIASLVGGTFSEYIFDDPDNLSGFEYAAARVSTTANTLWQDRQGWIRTTSVLAKAIADYTFTDATILDAARVVRWQGRMDATNTQYVTLAYRYRRRRQRNLTFSFRPWQLETPSTYLSGNEGGWELPQRSMIESAANGGGWTVIGDIVYQPVWPNGIYSTYSDSGEPMLEGLSLTPEVAADWCIGARWTGAKRWLQTVTENYTMVVTASDSIEAVGTLATEESYAIEDEADDETWESSLDFDDYVSGATLMSNGLDKKADLDSLRSDVTTAMSVALAKAQNEVLKSHRGTTVSFLTTFHPVVDLSHTVAVDTTYLDCKGKVRRVAHHWDIESGDCTTEIEVALSRHNGSGLASTDTLTPPSEPADPDETSPSTYHRLEMHLGGQDDRPVWDEAWDGFIVNLPFLSTAGSNTILGSWSRNPANPALTDRIYEEGFHILPPQIDASYANPVDVTGAATYDVEIPEDTLVLISG